MATWKVHGEVPDSDDEDQLESGSTTSSLSADLVLANDDEDEDEVNLIRFGGEEELELPSLEFRQQGIPGRDQSTEPLVNSTKESPTPRSKTAPTEVPFLASSQSSRPFQVPKLSTLLQDVHSVSPDNSQALQPSTPTKTSSEHRDQDVHVFDEADAMSHVILSSPLSSLSSPPESLLDSPSFDNPANTTSPRTTSLLSQLRDEQILRDESSGYRGALRHRDPIQLHPYALEAEKYRRTLMARGVRPLRLIQLQDRARQNTISETPDTEYNEERESQIIEPEDESFPDTLFPLESSCEVHEDPFADPILPLQPAEKIGEDEEFPDIESLVDNSRRNFIPMGNKRRKVQYSSKRLNRPRLPELSSTQPFRSSHASVDPFKVPPSPPATSSPLLSQLASIADRDVASHQVLSASSLRLSTETDEEMQDSLPTPETSVVKNAVDLTLMNFDDDLFASESDHEVHDNPNEPNEPDEPDETDEPDEPDEPDESIHRRHVGRKIRGVLPASWLRLDQQTRPPKVPDVTIRESQSLSPEKTSARRGVAIPKSSSRQQSPKTPANIPPIDYFLSDEDSESDSELSLPTFDPEVFTNPRTNSTAPTSEFGFAVEDDRVDAMLPSQTRQTRLVHGLHHSKRQKPSKSLFQQKVGRLHQPKITNHLSGVSQAKTYKRRQRISKGKGSALNSRHHKRSLHLTPPRLSILDVVESTEDRQYSVPSFLKIAARTAKRRKGLGRHSPTRKFIRLGNREDTVDAQSRLHEWRQGIITQRPTVALTTTRSNTVRVPLHEISNNTRRQHEALVGSNSGSITRSSNCHGTQQTILTCSEDTGPQHIDIDRNLSATTRRNRSLEHVSTIRPAQLETSETEYKHHYPDVAFRSSKKTLDALYRRSHRGAAVRGDIQLARFLADDDAIVPMPETLPSIETETNNIALTVRNEKQPRRVPRLRRKRSPKRIDVGAAIYRQPKEPLVLESLPQGQGNESVFINDGKLLGLGPFGTTYTHDFDIFPLQSGTHFHDTTFIGSGCFASIVDMPAALSTESYLSFQLGQKDIHWGEWNSTVSSELGVCFDSILEGLETVVSQSTDHNDETMKWLMFIIDYVQNHLRFNNESDAHNCVARFSEVLQGSVDRFVLMAKGCATLDKASAHHLTELSSRHLVLLVQILLLSRINRCQTAMIGRLESLLERAAATNISLLLSIGLEPIRKLYDDLQYLTFREGGIKWDRHTVQAWLITIQVMEKAKIPRISFWSIFNSRLFTDRSNDLNDARVLERLWYSMFTILPLYEFDKFGIIIPNQRYIISRDNWEFPQRILKTIFRLYATSSRQSPSFNDYCRASFSRCHLLIQAWGWRRYGSIIGTMFDFFASQNLAHLRNEEVYKSPHFLEELHLKPSLEIEPEDRCFHILLKLIAISIKNLERAGDLKGIRNLVTRVLPNHDRQYPKEEIVHQRDLASLRNHHDILCTLFWATPPEMRPSVNLIRGLVHPESSHKEAYMINLRAWANLALYVLISTPVFTAYDPFARWQSESFLQILGLYHSAGQDVEDQLIGLSDSAKQLITSQMIVETVKQNRFEIMGSIVANLSAFRNLISDAENMDVARFVLCNQPATGENYKSNPENFVNSHADVLLSAMKRVGIAESTGTPIVEAAVAVIDTYLSKVNLLIPATPARETEVVDEDSQDYGDNVFDDNSPRLEYIGVLIHLDL